MVDTAKKASPTSTPVSSAAPPSKKKKLPRVIILVLVAILMTGGIAWFAVQRGNAGQATADTHNSVPKYSAHLEGFTVNLADPEENHFLRVTMDIGFDHLPDGASREKSSIAIPAARVRDSILRVLTTCKAESLLTPDGKAQLKKNLIDSLTKDVPELGVREIYFTEFLVQR